MAKILATLFMFIFAGPVMADCSQADAVGKMQAILSSSEYSAFVSQAGTAQPTSVKREGLKGGLRQFGGNAGRAVAGVLQDQDNADQLAQAQASVATVQTFNQTLNDAGMALGQGDNAKACGLYDQLILGLGIQ